VFRDPEHRKSERSMLDRFRQEAATTGLPYAFDEWGWITFAQHHQLPTRLLDWSQSPLVGLYFACEPGKESEPTDAEADGEFFVVSPHALNKDAGDAGRGHPLLLRDAEPALAVYRPGMDTTDRRKPRAVIAPLLFDRIRFQTGMFTVAQSPNEDDDGKLEEAACLQRFLVPGDAKHDLREQLTTLSITEFSIYRDLDRISTHIKSQYAGTA